MRMSREKVTEHKQTYNKLSSTLINLQVCVTFEKDT